MKKLLYLSLSFPFFVIAELKFEAQLLHKDNIESLAVGDVDKS